MPLPYDLSDLDPFSPSPSPSPSSALLHPSGSLFPPTPSSVSTSSAASTSHRSSIAPPPQALAAQSVHGGQDPLGRLMGGLSVTDAEPPRASSSSRSPSPSTSSSTHPPSTSMGNSLNGMVRAHDERQSRILLDLSREPFAQPPTSSSSASASVPRTEEPVDMPLPSRTPRRRPSHPGTGSSSLSGFSPPRRLSGLMDLPASQTLHAASSPPASTSPILDHFHATNLERGAAQRRMREASGDGTGTTGFGAEWDKTIEEAVQEEVGGGAGEFSGEWGDFQTATPEPMSEPPSRSPSTREPEQPAPPSSSSRRAPRGSAASLGTDHVNPVSTTPLPPREPVRAATTTAAGSVFDPTAQPIQLVGVRPGVARMLQEDVAERIRPSLPPRLRLSSRWTLLYSLDQHGISLHTLFANLDRGLKTRDGGFVLVVKSERGEVFGGYCSEALKRGEGERGSSQRWGGDGSCFLWRATPFPASDHFRLGASVSTFKPTFRNTYFQHASSEFIALGGGNDGVFGLWIDGLFERGWTGRSETYGNEPLVGPRAAAAGGKGARKAQGERESGAAAAEEGKFEVVGFECWAVGS
ncbi:hypothetical protein JCM21900_003618 [Sporobolomyces salmonicolor]